MDSDQASRIQEALVATELLPEPGAFQRSHIVSLGGGLDADTYLVSYPGRDVVVKLNKHTLEAEAAALRAWRAHTTNVPEVLGAGTVPGSPPVKFLVLEAMLNDSGDVVETAEDYLQRIPTDARDIGRALGAELSLLHRAQAGEEFGNFSDSPGAERSYRTWSGYLRDFLLHHEGYIRKIGVPDHHIEKVRAFIDGCPAVAEARYLHGDVTIRNIAILSHHPPRISLFDPNPVCGDPSWDIAAMTNNVEYGERRQRIDGGSSETLIRDRELLSGFWETYPGVISERLLIAAQLLQAALQGEHRETAAAGDDRFDKRDVEISRQHVHDLIDRMST